MLTMPAMGAPAAAVPEIVEAPSPPVALSSALVPFPLPPSSPPPPQAARSSRKAANIGAIVFSFILFLPYEDAIQKSIESYRSDD
jgi:hypothetical protein